MCKITLALRLDKIGAMGGRQSFPRWEIQLSLTNLRIHLTPPGMLIYRNTNANTLSHALQALPDPNKRALFDRHRGDWDARRFPGWTAGALYLRERSHRKAYSPCFPKVVERVLGGLVWRWDWWLLDIRYVVHFPVSLSLLFQFVFHNPLRSTTSRPRRPYK